MPPGDETKLNIGRLIRVGSVFNLRAWLFGKCCAGASSCDGPRFSTSGEQFRAGLRQLHEQSALVPLPGAPPSSANRASSIQSSASRSHAALSTSSVAVLALARHSSAFLRYRSASSAVMPYHARRANPFQAVSLFWSFGDRHQANRSAPPCVSFTNVPLPLCEFPTSPS